LEGEDVLGILFDLLGVVFTDEVLREFGNVGLSSFVGDESVNLSSDGSNLRGLSIRSRGGGLLTRSLLGESKSENSDNVTVVGLAINSSFNEGLPLSDHRA